MWELKGQRNRILSYAIYGFVLGIFFPLVSALSELYKFNMPFNWLSIKALLLAQPLLMIISMAPIVLAASFTLIGLQSARHLITSEKLDQRIQEQEAQIRNEHLFCHSSTRYRTPYHYLQPCL